jgi:NDP-sugar pyrophosphorylase family protein
MKAMILAAGLGTRLRPLTDTRPKALVEVAGRPLLEITLTRLRSFGVNEVIVNVHHFADLVVDYLKSKHNFGMRIEISREDDLLLDTGGGLKKAAWFFLEGSSASNSRTPLTKNSWQAMAETATTESRALHKKHHGSLRQGTAIYPEARSAAVPKTAGNTGALAPEASDLSRQVVNETSPSEKEEPFILHNVDVISTIDLGRMLQFHNENHALATLAVQSRESSRLLLFNHQLQLSGRAAPAEQAGGTGNPACAPPEKRPSGVIPSETRNPSSLSGGASRHSQELTGCHSVRSEESAVSSNSPLVTRHSPPPEPLAFSGIHIISPRLLPMLTEEGVFPIIDAYLRLAAQGEKILAFRADEYYWRDLGRAADLAQAALDFQQRVIE